MCTDRLPQLGNSRRPASRWPQTNHFSPSNGNKLASLWVDTPPPPTRQQLLPPQRSRSPLKRFALSLLTSATLLALSSPSFAFTYEYVDRYAEPFAVNNDWLAITVDTKHQTDFPGDWVVGYHGYNANSRVTAADMTGAIYASANADGSAIGNWTITGGTLHIVERPDESTRDLSNTGILFYESTLRPSGSHVQVDTALDIDLQSFNNVYTLPGHGGIVMHAQHEDVIFQITTLKPVNILFYSTAPKQETRTYPQGIRGQNFDSGVTHFTAKDTVDVKMITTELNSAYGLNVEAKNLTTNDVKYHFEKDATFYLQAQKGAPGWAFGNRLASWNDAREPSEKGKVVLSNAEGSTYRVAIETKNQTADQTFGVGFFLYGNTRLAMAGKTELTFWEDPMGEASGAYYGVYGALAANSSYVQHFDNTFNELVINVDASKARYAYGIALNNPAGVETTTRLNRAEMHFNTPKAAPTGLKFSATNSNSKQNVIVNEALTFESNSTKGATMATFSSSAGGRIDAQLKDVNLTAEFLTRGIKAAASDEGSSTQITVAGNVTTSIDSADENTALFYTESQNAESALIDFTGGGTFGLNEGATLVSIGSNALINIHPTLATQITGYGGAYNQGKLDLHLSAANQQAQMALVRDWESDGVIDVTLENRAQWQPIGPTSHINTLTLQSQGLVDLRSAQGADESDSLGQAFLYTQALQGTGGKIALDVNTETNLGQILVIEEHSEGAHQLQIGNRASAVATGVPIKVVESVWGESNDEFTATFKEETPVEVGELKYYVVKTNEAKAMYATLTGETTGSENPTDAGATSENTDGTPPVVEDSNTPPSPTTLSRMARAAAAPEGDTTADPVTDDPTTDTEPTAPAIVTDIAADTNPNNWYLAPRRVIPEPEPQPHPLPDFTDTAKGMVSTASVQYLAAMLPLETLRERLGDIHTFKPLDDKATPWVKLSGTEWRVKPTLTEDAWDINFSHAKVGLDTRVGDKSLVGGYLAYSRFDTQHPAPAFVKGTGLEGGLYWTYLSENRTFSDMVLRVGRVDAKFDTTDTRGMSVKARDIDNTYWGLTWNVGRQLPLTRRVVMEPMALIGYTHFGASNATSSSGLRSHTSGYASLLTMLGSTVEGRFTTASGKPWTVYGKLFWEKEWLADTDIVFNGHNTYHTDFKDHRWVYGFGVEGMLGKASTWHVDVERSTGSAFRENWQVNAGLRIPF